MTPEQFRRLALCLPESVEQEHMGHPDFRVGGKIFATLHGRDEVNGMVKLTPAQRGENLSSHAEVRVGGKIFATLHGRDEVNGMVKLTPAQQKTFVHEEPAVYAAVSGGWGRGGATLVKLRAAKASSVRHALAAAWRNTAPKRLAGKLDEE